MENNHGIPNSFGLDNHGLNNLGNVYWNLCPPVLVEEVIRRKEGIISNQGAVVVNTGLYTGRSPNDKYIIKDDLTANEVWWGKVNRAMSELQFDRILTRLTAYLQNRDVFVQDLQVGAHPDYCLPIRVITETAWHSLFSRDLFIRLLPEKAIAQKPEFTVIQAPGFQASPESDGTNSAAFIILNFTRHLIIIGGSSYAGEVKKSIFSVMNYLLPRRGVLSMHCSANVGTQGDVALFFGLSGTGKTTLSSDPERCLIGDDEHGWGDNGVFNFEGGCYAKTIHLRREYEPLIWDAAQRFGSVLENVTCDPVTRTLDFDDDGHTENTRAAYPLDCVTNHVDSGCAEHPRNIFFLTADASGVMPPLARLTPEQAMYYFLSGYTSKVAGTEKGLGIEPQATFSTCFGAPFLPLNPGVYAHLLGEKISRHNVKVWLINTGWTGGPYGTGKRIHLPYTRAMVRAVLTGLLDHTPMQLDPLFGLNIPLTCPDVPDEILYPRLTWADPLAYDQQAHQLIALFQKNFELFASGVAADIAGAGPKL